MFLPSFRWTDFRILAFVFMFNKEMIIVKVILAVMK